MTARDKRWDVFEVMSEASHEQLVIWSEPSVGYRGIIAIHDTTMGPALGGTRFWNYVTDRDAVVDALRLAKGMTYKAAITGLNLGGGKSVIWGDNRTKDREMIFRAHGRAIESLNGRYITAEDVGTSPEDMEFVAMETSHVAGLVGGSGDPSPVTAYGVYRGIKACAAVEYGSDSLANRHVSVQGLGHVGYYLCEHLASEGARLTVTDIDPERVRRVVDAFGAQAVATDAIYDVKADVFAPCALGAVVNDETIGRLHVDIVAGAANNQLESGATHGQGLHERGVLYAPDYVINAGGLINVYGELQGWSLERAKRKAGDIYNTLLRIFDLAKSERIPTEAAANRVAEERLRDARHLQRTYKP
jgi:leucine dehydrogenase